MHILITGANGFMGRNLVHALKHARPDDTLHLIDLRSTQEEREEAAQKADFVFHLAGVNRPQNTEYKLRSWKFWTKYFKLST